MDHKKSSEEQEHGRYAHKPEQIPPKGWRDIATRVKKQMAEDNLDIVAAGVAFFAFLAIFPALTALLSIYGLVVNPATVQAQLSQITGILPQQAHQLISQSLQQIARSSGQALGWSAILSILLALWSANNGTKALFKGLNIAYDQNETRGVIKLTILTLLFTLGFVTMVIISIALVVGLPAAINALSLPSALETILRWLRWPVLAIVLLSVLTITYRYAPCRNNPKWKWVSWGSIIATFLWLAGSAGFSFYVSHFGNYNATYGSVAAVVILLFWFYLTSFIVLLGAEVNSEMERQTKTDTTKGAEKQMGKRGANSADTLGEAA